MSDWSRMARSSAAREFGRRHYRWYAAARYRSELATATLVLLGAGALAAAVWWLFRHAPAPVVLLAGAAALIIGSVLRVVWLLSPASRARTGSGIGIVLAFLAGVGLVVAAALTS